MIIFSKRHSLVLLSITICFFIMTVASITGYAINGVLGTTFLFGKLTAGVDEQVPKESLRAGAIIQFLSRESGKEKEYQEEGDALTTAFIRAIGDFSKEKIQEAEDQIAEQKRKRDRSREVSMAKMLAENEYRVQLRVLEDFIAQHGKLASELSESEIKKIFSDDYFYERMEMLGFYKKDVKSEPVNKRNAIIRAQSNFNIPITGKLDYITKQVLIENSDLIIKDTITGEYPSGMWTTIDKTSRILTVYIDDQVFAKYPVAVGRSIPLTPNGQYTFVSKYVNPRWGGGGYAAPVAGGAANNPLGKRWIGISKGGGGRYGVHGNTSPNSIGTYASHGCVRMINSDVEELYEYIELGTPVWIGTTDILNEWGIFQEIERFVPIKPDFQTFLRDTDIDI